MATRNNAEEDCCTMQLLFFINSKLNWIERIAIVLSGALTARHFFIIVKYTHLCWHRCLVSTSSLSPSLDWTMHMYIVHALFHTWHLKSKGDKNRNRPCNQSVHNNRIETKCTTCISWKEGKSRKRKGRKIETKKSRRRRTELIYSLSPIEIRCVDCLQTLHSIASHQSSFYDFVPVPLFFLFAVFVVDKNPRYASFAKQFFLSKMDVILTSLPTIETKIAIIMGKD